MKKLPVRKPEAWEAIDHGECAMVYDKSEADEYIAALESRLAEVEKERDDAKLGWAETQRRLDVARADLGRLVGLVEAYYVGHDTLDWGEVGEKMRQFVFEYRKGQQ